MADTVFARTSQAKHDFQLNKAMNMRCRSPEQHRRKGTTNSHTGNSTSTSLCTTSSPSLSSACRRGRGEGALWFPVLWAILPHPAPVVPCLVVPCAPAPPRWPRREAYVAWRAVTRMTYDCSLEREACLGGGVGHTMGRGGGPATRRRGTIYDPGSAVPPPPPPPMVPPHPPPPLWCGVVVGCFPPPPVVWCGVVWLWVASPLPVVWCGLGGSPLHVWICLGCLANPCS